MECVTCVRPSCHICTSIHVDTVHLHRVRTSTAYLHTTSTSIESGNCVRRSRRPRLTTSVRCPPTDKHVRPQRSPARHKRMRVRVRTTVHVLPTESVSQAIRILHAPPSTSTSHLCPPSSSPAPASAQAADSRTQAPRGQPHLTSAPSFGPAHHNRDVHKHLASAPPSSVGRRPAARASHRRLRLLGPGPASIEPGTVHLHRVRSGTCLRGIPTDVPARRPPST
ncbi:hypothetical protein B0H16DRAFT_1523487 [Mycena metata]|uniref:Uncharacterized protein n=1 Tax=Mycena metata TaxID=1033252 RepID=A0AAD7JJN6_9AGAR|nr:hypothetical protein B0H16DRAFT_1523487 [Mycena metata]